MIATAFASAATGCIDFVEPDLPERGAPAVVQATLRVDDDSLHVEALLAPGIDEDGFRRSVLRETLMVADTAILPVEVERNGTRRYTAEWAAGDVVPAGVLRFEAPVVGEVASPPPVLAWSGIRPLDDDTVAVARGHDLALRIATGDVEEPVPELRQWQLQLTGETGSFRIGADGVPPDTIVVPARWLPVPQAGLIAARLSYTRSATVRPAPGDYLGLLLLDVRLNWSIRITDAAAAGREDGRE